MGIKCAPGSRHVCLSPMGRSGGLGVLWWGIRKSAGSGLQLGVQNTLPTIRMRARLDVLLCPPYTSPTNIRSSYTSWLLVSSLNFPFRVRWH